LENPANRIELLDSIKYIPLFGGGPDCYLSLGGELREQYEFIQNDNFGLGSVNNSGCWLERLMLHSDWHFGPFVRAFVQFKSELEEGRKPGPRPPDRKRLDLNQAFVDFSYPRTNPSSNTTSFTLRLGRQEVDFGDKRLIAVREGANSRQSFDGARFIYYSAKARVDAFALQLDPDRPGYFDNDPSQSHTTLWGLYATIPLTTKSTAARFNNIALDLFYFGFYHGNARFNDGVGNETRHTLGGGYGELTISTDWILIFLEFTNSGLSAARRLAHFLSRSIWVTSCRNCPGRLESPVASRSPVGIPTRTINAWRRLMRCFQLATITGAA